ncbi:MAG: hypothetical protein IPF82_19070 [Blastocatellia bacterium]|nr:hypothetical protein [Blastocatellia bacterium]
MNRRFWNPNPKRRFAPHSKALRARVKNTKKPAAALAATGLDFNPRFTVTQEKTKTTAPSPSTKSSSKLFNRRNVGNGLSIQVLGSKTLKHSNERAFEITLG